MRAEREPQSRYEGKMVLEFIGETGSYGVAAWTDSEFEETLVKKRPKKCDGEHEDPLDKCCHYHEDEKKAWTIIGRVRAGRVYSSAEDSIGQPIQKWFPFVVPDEDSDEAKDKRRKRGPT